MPNLDSNQNPGFIAWWRSFWKKKQTVEDNETNRLKDQEEVRITSDRELVLKTELAKNAEHYTRHLDQKSFDRKEDFQQIYCDTIRRWMQIAHNHIHTYALKQNSLKTEINRYVNDNTKKIPERINQPPTLEARIEDLDDLVHVEYKNFAEDIWNFKIYLNQAQSKRKQYSQYETAVGKNVIDIARAEGTIDEKVKNFQESLEKLRDTIFSADVSLSGAKPEGPRKEIQTWSKDADLTPNKLSKGMWLGVTVVIALGLEIFITSLTLQPIFGRDAVGQIIKYCMLFVLVSWLVPIFVAGTEKTKFLPWTYARMSLKTKNKSRLKRYCQNWVLGITFVLCLALYMHQVHEINLAVFESIKAAGEVPPPIPSFIAGPGTPRLGETTVLNQALSWVINLILMPLSAVSIFNFMTMQITFEFEEEFTKLRKSYICESLSRSFIAVRLMTFERHMQDLFLDWYEEQAKSIEKDAEANLHKLNIVKRNILNKWRNEFETKIATTINECNFYSQELIQLYDRFRPILTPSSKLIPRTYATNIKLLNYLEVTDPGGTEVEDFLKQSYPTPEEKENEKNNEEIYWIKELNTALAPENIQQRIKSRTEILPALKQYIMSEKNIFSEIVTLIDNAGIHSPIQDFVGSAKNINQAMGDRCIKISKTYKKPQAEDMDVDGLRDAIINRINVNGDFEIFTQKNRGLNEVIINAKINLKAHNLPAFKSELERREEPRGDKEEAIEEAITQNITARINT